MLRVGLQDDVDENRDERVRPAMLRLAVRDPPNETLTCAPQHQHLAPTEGKANERRQPTKDDLTAVQDADEFVPRRLVMVDLEELARGEIEVALERLAGGGASTLFGCRCGRGRDLLRGRKDVKVLGFDLAE